MDGAVPEGRDHPGHVFSHSFFLPHRPVSQKQESADFAWAWISEQTDLFWVVGEKTGENLSYSQIWIIINSVLGWIFPRVH